MTATILLNFKFKNDVTKVDSELLNKTAKLKVRFNVSKNANTFGD